MKRILVFAAFLLIWSTARGEELVINGSFEQGDESPVGWTGSEGARWEDGGRSGKCAVLGPALTSGVWVTWKQEIKNFKPDTTYKFSAWVKADRSTFAQVLVSGVKPHKIDSNFFYIKAGPSWQLWTKDVVGDATSSKTVSLTLLNEGGPATFFFDDVSLKVRGEVKAEVVPVKTVPEVKAFREGNNLISNGEFEVGKSNRPSAWFHSEPACMPRNSSGGYILDPAKNTGAYRWEKAGYQSDRCVSVIVPGGDGWGGWDTQAHGIKPNTDYTLSFWLRMDPESSAYVLIFGKEFKIRNYFARASWHWSYYSKTINSGGYSGDCNIGFVTESLGNSSAGLCIDRVQLFEGTSPIGKNIAWMYHYLYDFTWISPDAVAPVAFASEWQFDTEKQPSELCYIVEIPEEVECLGVYVGRRRHVVPWAVLWTNPDNAAHVDKEKVKIGGKNYVRYFIRQSQLRTGDWKSFTNEGIVPVKWRGLATPGSRSRYCAMNFLWFYLKTDKTSGTIPPLFYHVEWEGGKQTRKKLAFRVTRIPCAPQPKRMILSAGTARNASSLNPQFFKDYACYGLNGIDGALATHAGAREHGMKYFATWINQPAFDCKDPEAKAMGIDGKRNTRDWCLEYRGPDWTKYMDKLKASMKKGINTFGFDDTRSSTCYCDKCKALFKVFLTKYSKLKHVDPSTFMAPGWSGSAEYKRMWENFPLWHYGHTAAAMKKELKEYAKTAGLDTNVYFGISSWLRFHDAFAAASLKCFDFESQQSYINCGRGSVKEMGDRALAKQKRLGRYALPYVPTVSPGLTYWHCLLGLDPHVIMKHQLLEMMIAAPRAFGYNVYAGGDFDLGDMKYTAEANSIIARFEDIITDGKVIDDVVATGTSESSVRAKKLGNELLVLVGDYSTYKPVPTEVIFIMPNGKKLPDLVDIETGETLKPGSDGTYRVVIKESRQRIFYSGKKKR